MAGEAIVAFATLTESNTEEDDELVKELRTLVRGEIGPFASPDIICITPLLPMVRSSYSYFTCFCCNGTSILNGCMLNNLYVCRLGAER